jgi:hypothetical protein
MICKRALQNKPLNRHSGNRSAARCRALHRGFLFTIPLGVLFAFPNTTIPPVSGRVRDAVTGEDVRGVNVELQVSHVGGSAIQIESKNSSDANGSFYLPPVSIPELDSDDPPDRLHYWLIVNGPPGGTGQEERSAETQILYNPMFNRRGQPVGDKGYFPQAVTFTPDGCDRIWNPACTYQESRRDFSVLLIPVLSKAEDCKKIEDSSIKEKCRELNTYRSAFVHVDSYEEVQKGKKLCDEVDAGPISRICLVQLNSYVANPAYDRPIKPQLREPVPPGMFPNSLAGIPMEGSSCGPRLEFTGRLRCTAGYGMQSHTVVVSVSIEEFPGEELPGAEQSINPEKWKPPYTDHEQATVNSETRAGGKILRYQGPQYNSYFWLSGNKHVEVFFYHPIPEREQFVSFFLGNFPSSLQ